MLLKPNSKMSLESKKFFMYEIFLGFTVRLVNVPGGRRLGFKPALSQAKREKKLVRLACFVANLSQNLAALAGFLAKPKTSPRTFSTSLAWLPATWIFYFSQLKLHLHASQSYHFHPTRCTYSQADLTKTSRSRLHSSQAKHQISATSLQF